MHQPQTYPPSRTFSAATILLAICTIFIPALAGELTSVSQSVYEFIPTESTITQTGGFAGVDWTYTLAGRFQLSIDPNAGTAVFTAVDANAVRVDDPLQSFDLNKVFHLTSLASAIADETLALFVGYADDGSSIAVTLVFREDGSVRLVGQTIPPMNSADFFVFTLDAVAERYGGGTGEPNDPYEIATAADLIALGESPEDYDKHFILMADIDLASYVFDRAVIAPVELESNRSGRWIVGTAFSGVLDGQGHVIRNLQIESGEDDDAIGLFGGVEEGGRITNLGVENALVKGLSYSVGGLVGFSRGRVSQCYSTGEIHGLVEVGGLIGGHYQGSISSSYSTATVNGNTLVGGLVGWNVGSITSSYSAGAVSGDSSIGGLVGWSTFSMIASSFWDIEASGWTDGHDGIGLTTAEMQTAATFLEAGWDFVGETDNGSEDIWWIDEGVDYPRLWWELEEE